MGDFAQLGPVPTLHRIGERAVEELERELAEWSVTTPLALIIPALHDELERPALDRIVTELAQVEYLDEIVIGLDGADDKQFAQARRFFDRLPGRHRILWHDGPRLRDLHEELAKLDLAPQEPGKGRNVWWSLGYTLARGEARVVGLHDADISTYSRQLPARLLYPVTHPGFGYVLAKGYYYRTDGVTLNGRVSRLLVTPLLRALRTVTGSRPYLEYLAGFRYPLAGEFSMDIDVARHLRIPSDWGLEIGVLSEVHRRHRANQLCQVDVADAYDHKHQPLSADDPGSGLHRMAIDIAVALFRRLAEDGAVLDPDTLRTVRAAYRGAALELVETYHHDAAINGLTTSRHLEEEAVKVFATALEEAATAYLADPLTTALSPSWSQVEAAVPDFGDRLVEAVEADARR